MLAELSTKVLVPQKSDKATLHAALSPSATRLVAKKMMGSSNRYPNIFRGSLIKVNPIMDDVL
jgi:hypothetical protein